MLTLSIMGSIWLAGLGCWFLIMLSSLLSGEKKDVETAGTALAACKPYKLYSWVKGLTLFCSSGT